MDQFYVPFHGKGKENKKLRKVFKKLPPSRLNMLCHGQSEGRLTPKIHTGVEEPLNV